MSLRIVIAIEQFEVEKKSSLMKRALDSERGLKVRSNSSKLSNLDDSADDKFFRDYEDLFYSRL